MLYEADCECRYDLKVECGASLNRHNSSTPDACLFFTDNLIVIDHRSGEIYALSLYNETTSTTSWIDEVSQKVLNMKPHTPSKPLKTVSSDISQTQSLFSAEKSRQEYITDVEKCQKFIRDGESYELCLTTQMRRSVGTVNPLGLYLELREKNPAPYAAWLSFPKEKLHICCSSPERFLRLDRNGMVEAKPIKGTIARGASPEADELLKQRLQYR